MVYLNAVNNINISPNHEGSNKLFNICIKMLCFVKFPFSFFVHLMKSNTHFSIRQSISFKRQGVLPDSRKVFPRMRETSRPNGHWLEKAC